MHAERAGCVCVCKAVSCLDGHPSSLPALLSAAAPEMPAEFDFITIDIDGADYWLMSALLDGGYRPHPIAFCMDCWSVGALSALCGALQSAEHPRSINDEAWPLSF